MNGGAINGIHWPTAENSIFQNLFLNNFLKCNQTFRAWQLSNNSQSKTAVIAMPQADSKIAISHFPQTNAKIVITDHGLTTAKTASTA
jgi:hypothetical protein